MLGRKCSQSGCVMMVKAEHVKGIADPLASSFVGLVRAPRLSRKPCTAKRKGLLKRTADRAGVLRFDVGGRTLVVVACHWRKVAHERCTLTIDHIHPLGWGGRNHDSNVVPCCADCNTRRARIQSALDALLGGVSA